MVAGGEKGGGRLKNEGLQECDVEAMSGNERWLILTDAAGITESQSTSHAKMSDVDGRVSEDQRKRI